MLYSKINVAFEIQAVDNTDENSMFEEYVIFVPQNRASKDTSICFLSSDSQSFTNMLLQEKYIIKLLTVNVKTCLES
jgi:hypothetical protein